MDPLKKYLDDRSIQLTETEFNSFASGFQNKRVEKGTFLLREGDVARQLFFVVDGCLRLYTIDPKGKEHILQFAPENWWIADIESASKGTPSSYLIDAIEDSDLLVMDTATHSKLRTEIPAIANLFQMLIENRQAASQKRIVDSMSATGEERYRHFLQTYPTFIHRIPLHMIASYLGMTPESLSRIRRQAAGKDSF